MYPLWYVDAVCKIPPGTRHGCKKYHRLLPIMRSKNDCNAYVWKLRVWEW